MTPRLILASGSPRRRELLAALGLPFEVITSGVDETIDPALAPAERVRQLAWQKAEAVAATLSPGCIVLGADTDVFLGGLMLGKPTDPDDAARLLRLLRGRPHQVISGLAVLDTSSGRVQASTVTTQVMMAAYDETQIAEYVTSGEPMDKAGAYAIQGRGGALVEGISGCYNNVVGFPLCEVAALLAAFGLPAAAPGPVCQWPDGSPCPRLQAKESPV